MQKISISFNMKTITVQKNSASLHQIHYNKSCLFVVFLGGWFWLVGFFFPLEIHTQKSPMKLSARDCSITASHFYSRYMQGELARELLWYGSVFNIKVLAIKS